MAQRRNFGVMGREKRQDRHTPKAAVPLKIPREEFERDWEMVSYVVDFNELKSLPRWRFPLPQEGDPISIDGKQFVVTKVIEGCYPSIHLEPFVEVRDMTFYRRKR